MHLSKEKTLVIIKPDGVQRSLIGEIIGRIERVGLKIVGMKLILPTKEQVESHYLVDPDWRSKTGAKAIQSYKDKGVEPRESDPKKIGQRVLDCLIKYFTSGPVVGIVIQGAHAVPIVRKLVGSTEPLTSDVGTIRGDFVLDSYEMSDLDGRSVRNLIHASGDPREAEAEIKIWFNQDEILNYRLVQEQILYDVNLDGILE